MFFRLPGRGNAAGPWSCPPHHQRTPAPPQWRGEAAIDSKICGFGIHYYITRSGQLATYGQCIATRYVLNIRHKALQSIILRILTIGPSWPLLSLKLLYIQSYTMRNGVLGVIGEVVRQVLNSPELDEQAKCKRDQLLDKLEVRMCNGTLYSLVPRRPSQTLPESFGEKLEGRWGSHVKRYQEVCSLAGTLARCECVCEEQVSPDLDAAL